MVQENQSPDLILTASRRSQTGDLLERLARIGMRGIGGGMGGISPQQNVEGTLVVDLYDAKGQELVWRGIAEDTLGNNGTKNQEMVNKAVQKISAVPLVLPSEEGFVYRRQADSITETILLCGPRVNVRVCSLRVHTVDGVWSAEDAALAFIVLFFFRLRYFYQFHLRRNHYMVLLVKEKDFRRTNEAMRRKTCLLVRSL